MCGRRRREGREAGSGRWEKEEAELLTRDMEGLPRAELLQKAELSVPVPPRKPSCGWFLDGARVLFPHGP